MKQIIDLILDDRTPVLIALDTWIPFNIFLLIGLVSVLIIVIMGLKEEWYGE